MKQKDENNNKKICKLLCIACSLVPRPYTNS